MKLETLEDVVYREIKSFLNGTNTDSRYRQFRDFESLWLEWNVDLKTSDQAKVVFEIYMTNDNMNEFNFTLSVEYLFREDEDNKHVGVRVTVPRTEEEYFQQSLENDLYFSLDFYKYLEDLFCTLRNNKHKNTFVT